MTYDPGSTGALSYLEAARELATGAVARRCSDAVPSRHGVERGVGATSGVAWVAVSAR